MPLKDKDYNELLSIKAMAEMLAEKAGRLLEKRERPVSTGISKNKMKEETQKFLLKRRKTRERARIRIANQNLNLK